MISVCLDKKFCSLAHDLEEQRDGEQSVVGLMDLYAAAGFDVEDLEDLSSEEGMEPGKEGCGQSDTYTTVRDPEDNSIIFAHRDLEQRL